MYSLKSVYSLIFLTQSLPSKGVNKDYYVIMTNANKHDDVTAKRLVTG